MSAPILLVIRFLNHFFQLMISTIWFLGALLFITKAEHLEWPSSENNPGKILELSL